jgi:hypothetical protein
VILLIGDDSELFQHRQKMRNYLSVVVMLALLILGFYHSFFPYGLLFRHKAWHRIPNYIVRVEGDCFVISMKLM